MDNTKSTSSSTVYSRHLAFQFNDASLATAQCARWKTCSKWASGHFFGFSFILLLCSLALQQPYSLAMGPSAGATIPPTCINSLSILALCLISPLGHYWSRSPCFLRGFVSPVRSWPICDAQMWRRVQLLCRCTLIGQSEFVHNPLSGYLGWTGVAFRSSRRSRVIDLGAQCLFFFSFSLVCRCDLSSWLYGCFFNSLFFFFPFLFFLFFVSLLHLAESESSCIIDLVYPTEQFGFFIYLKRFIWLIAYGPCICRA